MKKTLSYQYWEDNGSLMYWVEPIDSRPHWQKYEAPTPKVLDMIETYGRQEFLQLCLQKIMAGEQVEHFTKLKTWVDGAKINNYKNFQLKVDRANAVDLNIVAAHLGYDVRQRKIKSLAFPDERTPSLYLYGAGRGYYDFSASEGGSAIDFVKKAMNKDFREAVEFLQIF